MMINEIPIELKENIEIYEEIIQKLANLFIHLELDDNVIKIYENFRYMYTNGFLSYEKHYFECVKLEILKLEARKLIPMDVTGSILMTNYGICRHTTDFLYHLYNHLNYHSSQLFTYQPNLKVKIRNNSETFLTNFEAQRIIDNEICDLDLFSKEEIHINKSMGYIDIIIDYYPFKIFESNNYMGNHTINIVESKDGIIHILDASNHSIGKKLNDNKLLLDKLGLQHIEFIQEKAEFVTYFNTDYYEGLRLLEKNNTDLEKDILHSILYRDSCERYEKEFETFWKNNQKAFQKVNNNYNQLNQKIN